MNPHRRREGDTGWEKIKPARIEPVHGITREEQYNKLKSELSRYDAPFRAETTEDTIKFFFATMEDFVKTLSAIRKNDENRKKEYLPDEKPKLYQDRNDKAMLVQNMNTWRGPCGIIMYCYIDDTLGPTKDWKEEWRKAMGEDVD